MSSEFDKLEATLPRADYVALNAFLQRVPASRFATSRGGG